MMKIYQAPWGKALIVVSSLLVVLCVVNAVAFSFTGWYWSKSLGFYRAFVTDLNRTVVLRFEKRTVVVSPGEPEEFVAALNRGDR